jgi:mannose-6-phosphate isomerase-like protein (cupin superfamily)
MPEPNVLRVVSTRNSEHYTWGECCDGCYLLKNDCRHVIQERMPPGARQVMHFHRQSKQLFYVLGGVLTIGTESKSVTIPAGQAVVVEPPTPHQAGNESREPVDFLVVSSPPSHRDRFAADDP